MVARSNKQRGGLRIPVLARIWYIVIYETMHWEERNIIMAEKLELGCAVLGALCLIYYVVIVLYAGFGVDFA